MSQKGLTVIYLPGLGTKYDGARKLALGLWPKKRFEVEFIPMKWTERDGTYQEKRDRVLASIDAAAKNGEVVLVGESAGAAMAIACFVLRPNLKLITLCGKIGGAKSTGQNYYEIVPSFSKLLPEADKAKVNLTPEQKDRTITIRALKDTLIAESETVIEGVRQVIVPWVGHITTIFLTLTFFRNVILKNIAR